MRSDRVHAGESELPHSAIVGALRFDGKRNAINDVDDKWASGTRISVITERVRLAKPISTPGKQGLWPIVSQGTELREKVQRRLSRATVHQNEPVQMKPVASSETSRARPKKGRRELAALEGKDSSSDESSEDAREKNDKVAEKTRSAAAASKMQALRQAEQRKMDARLTEERTELATARATALPSSDGSEIPDDEPADGATAVALHNYVRFVRSRKQHAGTVLKLKDGYATVATPTERMKIRIQGPGAIKLSVQTPPPLLQQAPPP